MESIDHYKYPGEDVLIKEYDGLQKVLTSKLLILSGDDAESDLEKKIFGRYRG